MREGAAGDGSLRLARSSGERVEVERTDGLVPHLVRRHAQALEHLSPVSAPIVSVLVAADTSVSAVDCESTKPWQYLDS